ncbi:Erythromycin esterase homolog [Nonomuraea solani]|uniref:Erythromycin esterase homolog n=1 Tax=Nonomuraea solani TaxID=1144553 RepID=A0A1H5YM02_9ACTN|nr:erythromycin esterase family protein [Nonomuraea solani]SEG25171.1 Erythromycin esterase homolog [Nonomuraea solani]
MTSASVIGLLRSLPARPRLLGLGEPTHGEEALLELRNEIFRELVEHEGYRSIAIESDALAGLIVNDYVTTGAGSLDDVMARGFSHGFGASEANRELLRLMRAHNEEHPGELRFFGFDGPLEMMYAHSPRQALTALHGYLAAHVDAGLLPCDAATIERLAGDDARWTDQAAAMDPSRSVGGAPEVTELHLIADYLVALLTAESPHLIARTSREEWWRATLYGRSATFLLRYHAAMAGTSPARVWRLMSLRDAMMADNLLAIARQEARRGPTLVFAANRHLQREKSTWQLADMALEWWSAGAIAGAQLGDEYAFLAMAIGAMRHQGIGAPSPDTVEGVLSALDRRVIDARALSEAVQGKKLTLRTERADNHGYFPLDPGHLDKTDGVVFIKDLDG